MGFEGDLKKGNKTEKEFAIRLMKDNLHSIEFAPQGSYKDWDLKIRFYKDGKEVEKTFEVKDDIISSQTGNVGFEYRCNNKPSGIYASKADYIVYHMDGKFYYQERGELLYRLDKVEKKTVIGGDNNLAHLFLVSKRHLNELFKVL